MPTNPLTRNPIPVGADGAALAGIPVLPAAPASTFPEPGRRTSKALDELAKNEQRHARWQGALVAKEAELADLERRAGEDVLAATDDEQDAVAVRISQQISDLRGDVAVAGRTVEASAGKVTEWRRHVLEAEAVDLREQFAGAVRIKDEHDGKLRKLLDQVQAHDNAEYVALTPPALGSRVVEMGGPREFRTSRSAQLADKVAELEVMVAIADAAAAGQPVPVMRHGVPIPARFYSPRVRGPLAYFPELVA